jgi:hypothetical protein
MSRIDPDTQAAWEQYSSSSPAPAYSRPHLDFTQTLTYRHLERLRVTDPQSHRVHVELAKAERILALAPAGSPEFGKALQQVLKLRPIVRGY